MFIKKFNYICKMKIKKFIKYSYKSKNFFFFILLRKKNYIFIFINRPINCFNCYCSSTINYLKQALSIVNLSFSQDYL
jgi:hypothetical protein